MPVNDDLLNAAVRHQVFLERFKTGEVRRILALLEKAEDDIVSQLIKRDPTAVRGAFTTRRLEKLLEEIRGYIADFSRGFLGELAPMDTATYEADFAARSLAAAVPITHEWVRPPVNILRSAVMTRPFQGKVLREWVKDLERAQFDRLQSAIRMGVVEGETIDQIVRRIVGRQKDKLKGPEVFPMSRRGTRTLVRTAVNHITTQAREATYAANADIIKGLEWVSTLDSRTTEICMSRDGTVYPLNSGPRPPAHPGCRSIVAPITKSWRELGIDLDDAPEGTRASMNGQVPAGMKYGDWLKTQPAVVQDEVLGKTKGALLRSGKIEFDRFFNREDRFYSLSELRSREGELFRDLGL